jgi:hypothetical protein
MRKNGQLVRSWVPVHFGHKFGPKFEANFPSSNTSRWHVNFYCPNSHTSSSISTIHQTINDSSRFHFGTFAPSYLFNILSNGIFEAHLLEFYHVVA